MKNFFRPMDEMEFSISLRAIKIAWIYSVLVLFIRRWLTACVYIQHLEAISRRGPKEYMPIQTCSELLSSNYGLLGGTIPSKPFRKISTYNSIIWLSSTCSCCLPPNRSSAISAHPTAPRKKREA